MKSSGEKKIEEFLKGCGLEFVREYQALWCINPATGWLLPYDFQLKDHRVIIEIQGQQHKQFNKKFHRTQEEFEYQQKRDAYKKWYAEKHLFVFVEIFYEDFKKNKFEEKIFTAIKKAEEFEESFLKEIYGLIGKRLTKEQKRSINRTLTNYGPDLLVDALLKILEQKLKIEDGGWTTDVIIEQLPGFCRTYIPTCILEEIEARKKIAAEHIRERSGKKKKKL